MPSNYLQADERVIRYVPWSKLRRNEDDTEVYGPLGAAFRLRDGEDYLSVTWCEYFEGTPDETMRCAVDAIRNSNIDVKSKARFALAEVGIILDFMKSHRRKLRFIHELVDDNKAHAAVRNWPVGEEELLDRIAEEVWCEVWSKSDVDNAPVSACGISTRGKKET